MKTSRTLFIAVATVAAALATNAIQAREVSLDSLPPAVRKTVMERAGADPVTEIEIEKEDGRRIYEIEVERDGEEIDILVAEDGTFLGYEGEEENEGEHEESEENETPVSIDDLPAAARDKITEVVAGGRITEVVSEYEGHSLIYEAEYVLDGAEWSVEVTESGEIIEVETVIGAEALPDAVLAKILRAFPEAQIAEASAAKVWLYEVTVTQNGREKEITLDTTGTPVCKNHDDDEDEDDDDDDDDEEDEEDDDDDDDDEDDD